MYFYLFKNNKDGQWYWKLRDSNHKSITEVSESYASRVQALSAVRLVKTFISVAPIWDDSLNKHL